MKKVMFTAFALGLCLTANVMAQVPSYVPTNGLVGWWPFNGNANDESGNGNNGTVNGATLTADRFGNSSKAYSFSGNQQNIVTSNVLTGNNELTLSYWINIPSNGGGCVITQNKPTSPFYTLFQAQNIQGANNTSINSLYYTNANTCQIGQGQQLWDTTTNISNQWHNFIYTIDVNSDCNVYIDGVLSKSFNGSGFSFCTLTSGVSLRIGGQWISNDLQWFLGKIDDIGIWNRALSDQEISNIYNGNICYDYVTVTDTLLINTGITGYNPITYMNTLKIWPNPTNDQITIDAGDLTSMNGYSIRIENAQGQQVFQNVVNQQQFYIDITTWGGNGLYFVQIIDPQGNTVDVKKIIIQ
jgi:hypothetical protein